MTDADRILKVLWDDLCSPILSCAAGQLPPDSQATLMLAPLLIVETEPARVGLFAWDDTGPRSFGTYGVPVAGGAALARFLDAGLNGPLEPKLRPIVQKVIDSKGAQFVVSLRPDKGEATCTLVARGDQHPPIVLFTLKSQEPEVRH